MWTVLMLGLVKMMKPSCLTQTGKESLFSFPYKLSVKLFRNLTVYADMYIFVYISGMICVRETQTWVAKINY